MTWHSEAETWAAGVAGAAVPSDVPVVRFLPTSAGAAPVTVVVAPCTMTDSDVSMSRVRADARMAVEWWIAAGGDTTPAIDRLAEIADRLVVEAAAGGASQIASQTRTTSGDRPTYIRIVTATITVTNSC